MMTCCHKLLMTVPIYLAKQYICTMTIEREAMQYLLMFSICTFIPSCQASQDSSNAIISHVSDAHSWHFATIGDRHISLSLPVILYKNGQGLTFFSSSRFGNNHHPKSHQGFVLDTSTDKIQALDGSPVYDFSITKNVVNVLLSILLMMLFILGMARSYLSSSSRAPRGITALFIYYICFVRDHIAKKQIGTDYYQKFTPYLLTIFSFIWLNNTLGLLPAAANVTGNISTALLLSTLTLMNTLWHASSDYWHHLFSPPSIPRWLLPIMVPVELLGIVTKSITLMMRLFANMLAGHLVLLSIISILFMLETLLAAFIVVPLGAAMILLKLIVAFFQAYLFTLLSAISIGSAVAVHKVHPMGEPTN